MQISKWFGITLKHRFRGWMRWLANPQIQWVYNLLEPPKEDKEKAYSRIHKWQVSKRENYVNKFQDTFKAVMLTSSMIKKVIKCPRNSLTNSGNPTECPH